MENNKPLVENDKSLVLIEVDGDWIPLPPPSSYSSSTSTLVDSATSVSGKMLGSVVRESVARISLSWRYLEVSDWTKINQIFKTWDASGARYTRTVRFFDQTTGTLREKGCSMYVSDRSAGMWRQNEDGTVAGWIDCSLELTEV